MLYAIFILLLSAPLFGQVSTGTLLGDIRDQAAAVVPDAKIKLLRDGTSFERTVTSSALGNFRFDDLPPGSYSITVEKQGFSRGHASGISIDLNQKARLSLELHVGAGTEVITISAQVSPLQTEEPSEGYRLNSRMTRNLPLVGRNVISFVTLSAGAIPRQLGGFGHDIINDIQAGRGAVALNPPTNGARSTANSYILDGVYNTDRNVYAIAVTPLIESIQEFRVNTSLASAQFPQAGGAVVDVITKSGTRSFHGSAFEFFRNEATDAHGLFDDPDLPRPVFRQNQFGGSLGGPLPLASTYFFATYEGLRGRSAASTLHLVPDANLRGGDFSAGGSSIFDPLTLNTTTGLRSPFAGNRIPASRINPIARKYLELYEPLPNNVQLGSNYLDSTPNTNDNDSVSGRIDRNFGTHGLLFGRYTLNNQNSKLAAAFPELPTNESLRAQQMGLGYTIARSNWVNDARLSFTRLRVLDLPQSAFRNDVIKDLGINGFPADPFNFGLPYFVVTNFATVTDSTSLPQTQRDNSWYFADTFSITRARHTFRIGADASIFQFNYLQSQFSRGQYIFNGAFTSAAGAPGDTGDPFADFLLGYAQTTKRTVGTAQAYLRQHSVAGYVQDDWKPTSRLTLNLGIRYEFVSPFHETRNHMLNLDYSTLPPQAPRLVPVDSSTESRLFNFAPRVGFALRLPGEMVFRAGYGVYFTPEIAIEAYDLVRNGLRTEINQTSGPVPVLTLANGFPQSGSGGFPSYFGLDRSAATPYVQQWNASLQRDMGRRFVLEAAYIGSKGTHLGRFRRFNTPQHVETGENLDPRPGDLQSLRTFPALGPIFQRQHIASSSYNALQVKVERNFSNGLSLMANFTWSKSIDDADSVVTGQFESVGAQDERNLRLERGLSFFDVRRRFSAAFVYQLPAISRWRPLLRGWELSGILTFQDGTPLNPVYFGTDIANSGTPNRPNVVAGQKVSLPASQRSTDRYFNTDAFSTPQPYTFGNAGRNTIPGPGNQVVDLALHRRFQIRETLSTQLRLEAFNSLNHPNVGIPGPYPDFGPFFGKIFSVGDPRRIQLAVRLDF
jgi:outer membrane receptor protein involved in Fe transport